VDPWNSCLNWKKGDKKEKAFSETTRKTSLTRGGEETKGSIQAGFRGTGEGIRGRRRIEQNKPLRWWNVAAGYCGKKGKKGNRLRGGRRATTGHGCLLDEATRNEKDKRKREERGKRGSRTLVRKLPT